MILLNRHKMFPKGKWSFLITLAFIICLQLSNRRQFVSGDEEVASDLNVMPIEVDPNFKNFKYIGNKIIPDVSTIMKLDEPHLINLKEFLKAGGLTTLEYDGYKVVRDVPFSIIVPKVDMTTIEKPRLKDFILEHLIPGKAFGEFNPEELYGNSNGHKIQFTNVDLKWTLNGLKVIQKIKFNTNLTAIFIDGVLVDRKAAFSKRNIQEHNRYNEPQRLEMKNLTTKYESTSTKDSTATTTNTKSSPLMTFLSNMKSGTKVFQHFLSKSNLTQIMDDGHYTILIPADSAFQRWHPIDWGFYPFSVQEFTENILRNHFLPTSSSSGAGGASASQQTTILTSPSYSSIASQPSLSIASIGGGSGVGGQRGGGNNDGIISGTGNAVHSGPLRMSDIKNVDKMTIKTLGGESVVFRSNPSPSVNNVTILSDYTLPNGNQIFIISEVLFVSEAVVSKLHQMHKDKETPPLLAFPWFGAQFLSHSFLALERDSRFTQITRYLNNAEIAPYISGANYTFFVPEDGAFEKNGFNTIPDDILASPKGVKMLLNHFVKGRLYDRDLKDNEIFETIGGGVIKVQRKPGNNITTINMAKITESEIFVYNLGTMFYIDDILYSDILREYAITTSSSSKIPTPATSTIQTISSTSTISSNSNFNPSLSSSSQSSSNNNGIVTSTNFKPFYPTYSPPSSSSDIEIVPSEFITENTGTESDILLDNNNNNNNNNHNNNNNNHNNHNGRGRIPIDQISLEDELDDDEIITPKALPVRFAPKK